MFTDTTDTSRALSFGLNHDEQKPGQTGLIYEQELMTLGESIVDGSGDPFAILHTICDRVGIKPKSISIDTRSQSQSDPSLFIHLFSALFTYLPNSTNFHLLPLFTTILQRHPPSLPHFLSSPLWLSLPSILASPPQYPSTLQTQSSPQNERKTDEQSHLRHFLQFINSILLLCLSSSPPTPIPNKTLLSSSLSTLSSHPDPFVKVHSGSAFLTLNQLDGTTDETSMPVNELVAQRDALRIQIGGKDQEISRLTDALQHQTQQNKEKDETIAKQTTTIADQTTTITELTMKLGEFVAMEALIKDSAKDVKWIRAIVSTENAITVWNPTHFRKEGRRITSLETGQKSCFSDEITRGKWRLSVRCEKYDAHIFGVIESSQLQRCKSGLIREKPGSSVFRLTDGDVHQNGKLLASGNQKPTDISVVTMELDMNRHTLVLFVDGQRQPHSLANIPQNEKASGTQKETSQSDSGI
ncbi:hypothetical protein BLNAU_19882 [Blattamonas nauphoetae]|uniref:Uncharacterized protein n=1 Tax=Blattamonas nauphoetae TaxID=2049346 RepID=A0ABQ9X0U2_9EUKA|nr:hypothetical protein BLNAU_19882 [Blattamonas nauphoetae]